MMGLNRKFQYARSRAVVYVYQKGDTGSILRPTHLCNLYPSHLCPMGGEQVADRLHKLKLFAASSDGYIEPENSVESAV